VRTIKDQVAVVTGAGSGIGRAISLQLAQLGAQLALADVNEQGLQETQQLLDGRTECRRYVVDVGDAGAVEAFAQNVEQHFGRVSILVNNAGVAMIGDFADVSLAEIEWLLNINFWGVVHCCKFLLPLLRREPEAHIVNVCSVSALLALAGQTHYAASKFAVRGFTEALQQELLKGNVKVTSVYPAGVRTPLVTNARVAASANPADAAEIKGLFAHLNVIPVDKAARLIINAILQDKSRLMIGSHARMLDTLQRLFPSRASSIITGMLRRLS
jgi:NAD(P)-dependent dehydrogenase (short-subunit alcohol dehydrogenase family)